MILPRRNSSHRIILPYANEVILRGAYLYNIRKATSPINIHRSEPIIFAVWEKRLVRPSFVRIARLKFLIIGMNYMYRHDNR